jgi:hypothetical protein
VRFSRANAEEAGRLWSVSQVEVCEPEAGELDEQLVWFRGEDRSEQVDFILRGFLSGQRFDVLPDGQLRAPHARVPRGFLPTGPWIPLRSWLELELPVAGLAGQLGERRALGVVRAAAVAREPELLITDAASWHRYALAAPQVRLRPLRFACDGKRRVLLQGRPLPPLPGTRFVVLDGIAIAAGWTWEPRVPPAVVREVCRLDEHELAVFFPDGRWERVGGSQFVAATRQSVRASLSIGGDSQHRDECRS